jgi:hypothetical protein
MNTVTFAEGSLLYYDNDGKPIPQLISSSNNIMFDRFGGVIQQQQVLGFTADAYFYSGFNIDSTHITDSRLPSAYINDNTFQSPKFKNTSELAVETYRTSGSGTPVTAAVVDFHDANMGGGRNITGGNIQYVEATGGGVGIIVLTNPPPSGVAGTMQLIVTNGGLWNSTATVINGLWPGGTAPTLQSDGIDILSMTTIDGGSNYYCFLNGENMS